MPVFESECLFLGDSLLTTTRIKEGLRKEFANLAETFIERVKKIEQAIGSLSGPLQVRPDY